MVMDSFGAATRRWVEMQPEHMTAPVKRGLEDDDGSGKKKRVKKEKDPNAPKRPMSAYLVFQNENREKFKDENPGITHQALLALAAEKWAALGEAGQKAYRERANKEMAAWHVEAGKYNEGKANVRSEEEEEEETPRDESRGGLLSRFAEAAHVLLRQGASPSSAVAAAAAIPAAATAGDDSDSSSDSSESSDEEESPEEEEPAPVPAPSKKSKSSKSAPAAAPSAPEKKSKKSKK